MPKTKKVYSKGINPKGRPPIIKSVKMAEDAIKGTGGIAGNIAKKLGVSRAGWFNWVASQDPEVQKHIKHLREHEREQMIDVAENSLFSQVQAKEPWATKYTLSTLWKNRGYVEKSETEITSKNLNINASLPEEKVEELLELLKNKDD